MRIFLQFKQNSRKIEFAQFYNRSIGIVESYQPEVLKISTAYDEAKTALLLAEDLRIQNYKVPMTAEQSALSKRLEKALTILLRFNDVKRKQAKSTSTEVIRLHEFFESYLRGYSRKSLYQKTGVVDKMLSVIQLDSSLLQTVETEGLSPVIAKIKEAFNELETVYKSRRKIIADREKVRTEEIKRNLYFNLRELFSSIEMAELANPELNYVPLINELNQEIMRFNAGSKPHSKKPTGQNLRIKSLQVETREEGKEAV